MKSEYPTIKMNNIKKILLVTGESSGDMYGSKLVKAIMNRSKNICFYGVGGPSMQKAGVKILIDTKKLSVMGITEIIPKIPVFLHAILTIKTFVKKIRPNLIILIDFPDFNFYLASLIKKFGIPILFYIPPQVWAWRRNRLEKIKRLTDHVALILPFEDAIYKKENIHATFVGHPLLDKNWQNLQYKSKKEISIEDESLTIGLFPGSRNKEIIKLLPVMLDSSKLITQNIPSVKFIVSHSDFVDNTMFTKIVGKHKNLPNIVISRKKAEQIFEKCDLLITTSGTVTLEAALYGIPSVIIYKMSLVSYCIGKLLVNVKHIGLPNLILNKRIIPEILQKKVSPINITKEILSLLKNRNKIDKIKRNLLLVRKRLGAAGASEKVAKIAINMLNAKKF